MAETQTLPTVYTKPDLSVTVTEQLGQSVKAVIESRSFAMIAGVAICEALQWIKVADYVPGHWENYYWYEDGQRNLYRYYVPEQPRRMLLSQALSTTLETAVIATSVIGSISGDSTGLSSLLSTLFTVFKK